MKDRIAPGELLITYLPLSTLLPNSGNARTHTKRQIQQIAESIKAFGFTNPVLIDHRNTIIAGHGRFAAAKLLGIDQIPTIRLEGLSPDQIRAYVLADNRLAEKAGWDTAILAIELQHLVTIENLDVTVTGFDVAEIDLSVQRPNNQRDRNGVFRRSESGPAISKSGDIWLLGPHRLVCGSSTEPDSYEAVDAAIRRWQKYSGDRAIHSTSGKCFDEVVPSSEISHV